MKNNTKRNPFLMALVLVLAASIVLPAAAAGIVGDVNGDGKVSVFDAQMLLEAEKGLRELTEEQMANAGGLSVQELVNSLLGIEKPEPETGVQVGDTFNSSELAPVGANGENGMTLYHTADGKTLTPFTGYDANNHNGRWYYYDGTAVQAYVDPFVNAADNYGWIGSSASAYVVIGYEMPATGTVTLTNWLARHMAFDTRILISKGSVENIVGGFDLVAGHENGVQKSMTLNVTEGETVYVSYKPLNASAIADTYYLGYKTSYTYTYVGEIEEETVTVSKGDEFKFVDLAGANNGDNGLTFYYTADGVNLTPYSLYDATQGRWYEVTDNTVSFFDPQEVAADNYGLAQTSAAKYVVAGYEVPATGTVDLFTWTVTQAGTGHEVTVSLGSLNNVIGTYTTTQGVVAHNTYSLNVTKGQTIYLTYKPIEPAAGEWLGYQTKVTYTKLPIKVEAGSSFEAAQLAPSSVNGDNGMTLYYCDGTNLTPYATMDPNTNGGRWYHAANNAVVTFVDPAANVTDNYGLVGSAAGEYVVAGFEMPAAGQIQLDTWLALHTASPYRILISKGSLTNVVAGRDVSGVVDTISYEHDVINVDAGEMIYVSYIALAEGAASGTSYAGYKIGYTYLSVGQVEDTGSDITVNVGDAFKFVDLAGANNGDNGLTFYHTADSVELTPYTLYAADTGRWYDVTDGLLTFFDPKEVVADNYGLAQTSSARYVVAGYEVPATGTVDLFTWTVTQGGTGHDVTVALGSPNNVIGTYTTTQGVVAHNTYSLNVTEGQTIYLIYKPTVPADSEWLGYKATVTYTAVG